MKKITWEQMRSKLAALNSYDPLDGYTIQPGKISIWQVCTAYQLPGGPIGWGLDVNLMPRTDFNRIFGLELTIEEKVNRLWAIHPELH